MWKKLSLAAGVLVMGAGLSLSAAGGASADPAGWVGPYDSDWTCGQAADQMMGSSAPMNCTYRSNDSRGAGYYFQYHP